MWQPLPVLRLALAGVIAASRGSSQIRYLAARALDLFVHDLAQFFGGGLHLLGEALVFTLVLVDGIQ